MVKIALFDHCRKFTSELINHWGKQGYEVKIDRYLDPALVKWADITFFEFCDISIQRASHKEDEFWKGTQPQDKNIIVRCHDIDAWVGNHKGVNWNWVNHLVFVADHIREKVLNEIEISKTLQVHCIKHGINLDKYTFRKRKPENKIAWIGNICQHKCLPLALQVLVENPEYELHVVGTGFREWEQAYVNHFVKVNNLKYLYTPVVDDINEFLEDKSYLLLTSFKEAFSFVVGEAMAKGIKPLIHNFLGADKIWPKELIWNKVSDIKPMLQEYNSWEYRDYIKNNYSLEEMLKKYDEICVI